MYKGLNLKRFCTLTAALILGFLSQGAFASANFNIVPDSNYTLPTSITSGVTASAYYTITNLTSSTRRNYSIQGLPATVVQNTSSASNCPALITLEPHQSCTLRLDISGPVSSYFALCVGNTCTRVSVPLVVAASKTAAWRNISQSIPSNYVSPQISAIAALSSNPSVLYASGNGTAAPYVFKSVDSGQTWSIVNQTPLVTGTQTWAIQIDPSHPSVLYLASNSGVFKSTDAGLTWLNTSTGLPNTVVLDVKINPTNTDILYAATETGLYQSTNAGLNWNPRNGVGDILAPLSIYIVTIDPTNSDHLFVGINNVAATTTSNVAIYTSTDGGLNWSTSSTGIPVNFLRTQNLIIDNQNTQICYAALRNNGVYKSTDGCQTWTQTTFPVTTSPVYSIGINPSDNTMLVATTTQGRVYSTTNSGANWTLDNTQIISASRGYNLVWPVSNLLVLGNLFGDSTGIPFYLTNSVNPSSTVWQPITSVTQVPSQRPVRAVAVNAPNSVLASFYNSYYFSTLSGLGLYDIASGGASAVSLQNSNLVYPLISGIVFSPLNPNVLFVSNDTDGIYTSTNGGGSWQGLFYDSNPFTSLTIAPSNPNILYVCDNNVGVYQTIDSGSTWSLLPFFNSSTYVNSIVVDQNNSSIVYAAAISGSDSIIYKSTDGAVTFQPQYTILNSGTVVLSQSPFNGQNIYAVSNNGVLQSNNGGLSWFSINNGLPSGLISNYGAPLIVSPANPNTLYVAFSNVGVYQSNDAGQNWFAINQGLNGSQVISLAIDPFNPTILYAGTSDQGVFEYFV